MQTILGKCPRTDEFEVTLMDPLVQDKLYTKLYRMWEREHSSPKIQKISNNGEFLTELRNLVAFLRSEILKVSPSDSTLQFIYQKTIENIQYMISDTMELRAEKLIQFAKDNTAVLQNSVFDFEWQYYQQLVPAFKGFSKSTQRIIQDLTPEIKPRSVEIPDRSSVSVKTDPPTTEKASKSFDPPSSPTKTTQSPEISLPPEQSSPIHTEDSSLSYVTILTLQSLPIFVGRDLKDYGPVAKGEIAMIPKQNALIFKEENMIKIIKSNIDHSPG